MSSATSGPHRSKLVKESERQWGKSIKLLREKQWVTQRDMADALGMSFSNYTKIERGLVGCRLGVAMQICYILGVKKIEIAT